MAHIAVERNRRRQMNDNLKVLRSLTPCFYIKRGDQASIIGGVIDFIKELHQVVDSLEANKRRKTNVSPSTQPAVINVGPGPGPSTPRLLPPRPLIPEPSPKSSDHQSSSSLMIPLDGGTSSLFKDEVVACCNSTMADVEAKISGSNVALRTVSKRSPTQLSRIITVLERFSLEILHLNVSSMEDTVLYSFVIKIGLECELSLEELASQVQQSFSSNSGYSKDIITSMI